MNNGKITSWAIIVLVIIAGCVYMIARSNKMPDAPIVQAPNEPAAVTVDYYCTEGTIAASYAGTGVSLTLGDGRTMTLAQGISASGVRYENATAAFITKGSNGFLEENGVTTYGDCVAGTRAAVGNSFVFTDAGKTFSFMYPNIGTLSGTLGYDVNWRQNTDKAGMLLAQVSVPKSFQPGTNFSEAKFTVGTSSDATAVKTCLSDNMGGSAKGTKVTINGLEFTKLTASDAGAGNLYDTTSYRTVKDGQCYAVEYTIHSTQFGNYPPEAGIKAYDKAAVTGMLEGIVRSFKFL